MAQLAKADKIYASARKKATKFDWFGMSKQQNMEDAAEMYEKAAAQYKIAKEYSKSGDAYKEAAQCKMASDDDIGAKQSWREAGKMYRHSNFELAIEAYQNAIQLNLDGNKFTQAARLQEEIGDMLLEDEHIKQAIEAFEQAADYYKTENDDSNALKRLLKAAHLYVKTENYERAIEIFEKAANESVDNKLLRWKVKEYLFKALLCQMCAAAADEVKDWTRLQIIAEKYQDTSDIYGSSRESKFLDNVIESVINLDMDAFKDANVEYEKISRLEPWAVSLLLNIEHFISSQQHVGPDGNELFGDDDEKGNDNDNNNTQGGGGNNTQPPANDPFNQTPAVGAPDLDDL